MSIHQTIRLLREAQQWSQEEMAEKLNMSPNGYARIERGETRLYHDKLEKIADIFQIKLSDLMAISEGGQTIIISGTASQIYSVNRGTATITFDSALELKDELLKQKDAEITSLKKIIELLEKK